MRVVRFAACLFLLFFVSLPLPARTKRLTVRGTLTEILSTGAETTRWTIDLNPVIIVDGTVISSLEVKSADTRKLESLKDKFVRAKGRLTYSDGADAPELPVLALSSIKPLKDK